VITVMNHLDTGRWRRVLTLFPAILAAAILLPACGGSHATHHPRKSAATSSAIKFARCMRANGVPSFPDSGATIQPGSSRQTMSINGVSVSSPAFESAQQKCEHYISSPPSVAQQAKFKQEILKVARCMRAHGIKAFPDSGTFNTSSSLNPDAPAFQAASKDCGIGGVATSATLP
jgi:hypothetical protein